MSSAPATTAKDSSMDTVTPVTLTIPFRSLAVVTFIAGLAGALAAVIPAHRAARLDILRALTTA